MGHSPRWTGRSRSTPRLRTDLAADGCHYWTPSASLHDRGEEQWFNHWKTIGKPQENGGLMGFNGILPSGNLTELLKMVIVIVDLPLKNGDVL